MSTALTLAGGVALGLAATPHCMGMYGGVAAMTLLPAGKSASPLRTIAAVHAGRLSGYALLGALAGGFGAAAVAGLEPGFGHVVLRWAAALSLGYIGLSTAGLLPAIASFARLAPRCSAMGLGGSAFIAGLGWGLLPCAMVYGALLYAMFTASFLSGALVMAGFGIGTLPGIAGASACFLALRGLRERPFVKVATGAAIALLGLASIVDPGPAFRLTCRAVGL